jgi:hypothetical protein
LGGSWGNLGPRPPVLGPRLPPGAVEPGQGHRPGRPADGPGELPGVGDGLMQGVVWGVEMVTWHAATSRPGLCMRGAGAHGSRGMRRIRVSHPGDRGSPLPSSASQATSLRLREVGTFDTTEEDKQVSRPCVSSQALRVPCNATPSRLTHTHTPPPFSPHPPTHTHTPSSRSPTTFGTARGSAKPAPNSGRSSTASNRTRAGL